YVEEGDPNGVPLVLLHGFPDMWYGWRYQIRALAKEGYRVIAMDNLGYGGSDQPKCPIDNPEPYTQKSHSEYMADLLDQLGIKKAVFIGHDWGALLVWRLGHFLPDRCLAVVGIGIPYHAPTDQPVDFAVISALFPHLKYIAVFQTEEPETWFGGDPHEQALAIINTAYATRPGTNVEETQYYIDQFSRTTFHGAYNYYRAMKLNSVSDLQFVGKPLTVPALHVIAEKDPIVPADYIAMISTDMIQDLKQAYIPEGNHNVHSENPEELNKILIEYLDDLVKKRANDIKDNRISNGHGVGTMKEKQDQVEGHAP
ncbi:Bifunctional epoxide hydrolase 2, partial [Lobosporangium transversale]